MKITFYHIFSIIAIFQSVFLSCFLVSRKKNRNTSNSILSVTLLIFALIIAHTLINSRGVYSYFNKYWKIIPLFSNFSLTIGPLIYLYLRSLRNTSFRLNLIHLLHFLPFVVVSALMVWFFLPEPKTHIIKMYALYKLVKGFILIQNLIYIIMIFHAFVKLQKEPGKSLMKDASSLFLNLIVAFALIWLLELSTLLVVFVLKFPGVCAYTTSLMFIGGFVICNLLLYIALSNPNLFISKRKYEYSGLSRENIEIQARKLYKIMNVAKPYLDPQISLAKLAEQLEIPSRNLSQIINEYTHMNFNDLINHYRIEECKEQMQKYPDKTISEIFYSAGFNSKSAFNTAFRKFTGITPTQYLESLRKNGSER